MKDLRSSVRVVENSEALAREGAQFVADRSRDAIAARGTFSIALTGGSSPLDMYATLAREPHRSAIAWSQWQVFWGDDRAVAPDRPESNFGAAHEKLLRHVPIPPANVHRMPGERPDLDAAAAEYERTVRANVPGGDVPRFDLVLLGIGNDGHILSLHPQCGQIEHPTALVVALHDPPMNPRISRITFTPPLLTAARAVLVLAVGDAKRAPLDAMIRGADDPMKTPAQLVRRVDGDVVILSDRPLAT